MANNPLLSQFKEAIKKAEKTRKGLQDSQIMQHLESACAERQCPDPKKHYEHVNHSQHKDFNEIYPDPSKRSKFQDKL